MSIRKLKKHSVPPWIILVIIFIIFAIIWSTDGLQSISFDKALASTAIVPVEGTSFKSEDMTINDTDYYVYATLNNGVTEYDKNTYLFAVGRLKGIRHNQNEIVVTDGGIEADYLFSSDYTGVSNIGNYDVTNGSEYYGTICYGVVPLSCTSLVIDDVPAKLVRQTFDINGKQADFYIYYCAIYLPAGPDDLTHAPEAIATDKNGHTYSIYTAYDDSTGLYGSTVKQIK